MGQSFPAGRIGLAGRLRIAVRAFATLGWLGACLVLYAFAAPLPGRNPVSRLFLGGLLRVVGARMTIVGKRPSSPAILLANHVSWIDILALAGATGTAFVAHDGLAGNPILRFLCRLNRTVFIARHDRASIGGQVDQVQQGLLETGVLTLFPEGTTNDGATLLPFKSSLLAAVEGSDTQVAVLPVWLDYGAEATDIAWAGDEPGLANVLRLLARSKPVHVTVHLLPPLASQQRKDRKTIATAAREAIAATADQRVAL
jgi:1-acyl-sn-glycerol-3-phosphate acyltransferase